MTWKNVGLALAGLAVIVVFRASGWISSFWMGLAILGIIGGIAILQALPTARLNIVSKIFVMWLAVTVGLPAIWQAVSVQAPFTSEASEKRAVYEDLRQAERINPPALRHNVAYKRLVDRTDELNGSKLEKETEKVFQYYNRGIISREEMLRRDQKIRAQIVADRTWREGAGDFLTGGQDPQHKTWREELEELYNTPNRVIFWMLGLLVIATSIVLSVFRKKFTWMPIIFIILVVLGDRLVWGGLITTGNGPTTTASAPTQHRIVVQIPPNNQLSDWVILPVGSVGNWQAPGDIEFLLPDGKTIKVANGNTTYKLGRICKFRLRGDPGEAVFTIN
ncbi:MAG: hypothetical protein HY452_00535 [Parcubacteria group bacterium]|nr:hypothetical protein [Parcubacteria group bacterium]